MHSPTHLPLHKEPRADYVQKVTGTATFASDIEVPGMLHGKILRSTVPHARIRRIDASAALAMPGVVAVLTGEDLKHLPGSTTRWGLSLRDRPVIALEKVRYVGDPVAAVAAMDERTAEEALEAIVVDYETLPYVTTAREALAEGAPLVHQDMDKLKDYYFRGECAPVPGTNQFQQWNYESGTVEEVFAGDVRVFEDTFTFPMVFHYAMEPHVCVAHWKPNSLEIWSGGQTPTAIQRVCSEILGVPLACVRVHSPYVGGGFGGKASVKIDPLVASLSWKARAPVRVCLSIPESMLTCRRLDAELTLKTAVNAQGRIVAKSVRAVLNGGAYADTGPSIAVKAAIRAIGPYHIPNLKLEAVGVYTNTVPGAAFRSIGGPQAVWATESQMDIIAAALGRDPVEFRLLNMADKGQTVKPDLRPMDVDMRRSLREAMRSLDSLPEAKHAGRRGRGVAVGASDPGIMPIGGAIVRLRADGSVNVSANTVEIGQGSRGVLRIIAEKVLRQPLRMIAVAEPDTLQAPYDWGTGASRSTVIIGLAVQMACEDVIRQVADTAAEVLGGAPEDYRIEEGRIEGPDGSISFMELLRRFNGMAAGEFLGVGRVNANTKDGAFKLAPLFWETGANACEIALDEGTGAIRVLRVGGAADLGYVMNRKAAEGQDEGAMVMGLGHTLSEEYIYEDGQVVNGTLFDYKVPNMEDVPLHVGTTLIESGDGPGPFGARGGGEGAILPVAPAVANALFQGWGIRIKELPLTPERVWRALEAARAGRERTTDKN
ncbi:xanthine dehydrogenase family protein molybdopterin-binding subunit [Ramlibacter henchirensis]|uniref:Xanthine dehydrogenase family protein molybdopterin-binding subunit n=1 Tax=Ramlibacter henchirensis TaxID=204072 RepID=A0A4Z0BX13_9BURK|nr:xanthine dehydrogenase family protein molybdopterin-binding subunit [Ramlibacter henchirensis]TFZ02798.1 xanthine dehydrogenase family protein molybdopterin-binding subunit [Ramlibacter henchirensis]